MQQVNITLYRFGELSEAAQQKALNDNRFINVDDNSWYAFAYDDFCSLCGALGIAVKREDIHFNGFYAQSSGSVFESVIDIDALLKAARIQGWREYAPDADIDITPCPCDKRVIALITKGIIDASAKTRQAGRSYCITVDTDFNYSINQCKSYENIDGQLLVMEQWLEKVTDTLNAYLFKCLQSEYEWLITDECVQCTIESCDLFTVDGKRADDILAVANPTN